MFEDTSTREYGRLQSDYESLFFTIVNDLIKKDAGVKNGRYAAIGAGTASLDDGHIYWMKDIVGDTDELQGEFDAMSKNEQSCANRLQTLIRDLMLYHVELVISSPML